MQNVYCIPQAEDWLNCYQSASLKRSSVKHFRRKSVNLDNDAVLESDQRLPLYNQTDIFDNNFLRPSFILFKQNPVHYAHVPHTPLIKPALCLVIIRLNNAQRYMCVNNTWKTFKHLKTSFNKKNRQRDKEETAFVFFFCSSMSITSLTLCSLIPGSSNKLLCTLCVFSLLRGIFNAIKNTLIGILHES